MSRAVVSFLVLALAACGVKSAPRPPAAPAAPVQPAPPSHPDAPK